MKNIVLGTAVDGTTVEIDLKTFLTTRCLIQAASGGGKSRTLRRLAEQLFGRVPTFIIDREGEFSTLREKYGFVLSGKGGETATDPRTAELLCLRLLENNASAIFDLYDLKEPDRHAWVRNFLDALMNAPKTLWRPVVIMVDEAHRVCPERGMGESEAYQSMIDLATDGRKRGFCGVYATQRLGKLSKNASAELLNRLIGRTIEDLDVDRAADLMSVRRSDRQEFDLGLKQMKPGHFWAFGQAVAIERKLVLVGQVETRHPEPGTPAAAIVPPTPEMVKKLLPQLADIPKEAEHKIRTEEELRAEIQNLKIRLNEAERRAAQKTIEIPVEKIVEKIVEVPAVDAKTLKAIHQVIWNIERATGRFDKVLEMEGELRKWAETLSKDLNETIEAQNTTKSEPSYPPPAATQFSRVPAQAQGTEVPGGNGTSMEALSNPQLAILRGLREFNAIDIDIVPRAQLAGWLGKKISGSFMNDLSRLKLMGYIDHHETPKGEKAVVLTADGLRHAPQISWQVTPDGVFAQVLEAVSGPQKDILKVCRKHFPKWLLRDDVAQQLNKVVSGSFLNDLSKLHTAMMIDYGEGQWKGHIRLMAWTILSQEAVAV
jgi:uncharacterized protein DUF87